ncbi:MAG: sulfatase-like hydrolase/transferase [Clostridiales bacterium]|nr:sulfatase-like hydrolase/transferase [Clostridiales bacterium]
MKPNIVFILSDDQGPWAMHCAGTRELVTPNMDLLAREGLRYENFYCASPVCSPARASLLTGLMPSNHGILDWLRGGNVDAKKFAAQGRENPYGGYADENEPIAYLEGMRGYTDMLCENGYVCALSGKWHLGDSVNPQKGFSDWYTIGKGGCYYYHPDIVENGTIDVKHGQYITDLITARACRDIDTLAGNEHPFYLSVHYTAPHSPWSAEQHPRKWIDHYDKCTFDEIPDIPDHPDMTTGPVYGTHARRENLRGYYAAISAMDEGLGMILDKLREKGILDDTLVIFSSDNGMSMGHHGIWGKGNGTYPVNMFDQAVKVPFLVRCPALIKTPGLTVTDMVSAVDLYPTLCELVGAEIPAELPGASFLPTFGGGHSRREEVVIYDEYGPVRMIRRGMWKYIHRYPDGPHELYDMENDPGENTNLYGRPEYAAEVAGLKNRLESFFEKYRSHDFDAKNEPVNGSGQFCRPGKLASLPRVYGNAPKTSKEQ